MPEAARKIRVHCEINGRVMSLEAHPMARLLDVLREQGGLTGTKEGCGEGECGACSIEIDGALVNSCLIPCVASGRRDNSHDRGSCPCSRIKRRATGVFNAWGRAVRYLHTGNDSCGIESSRTQSGADGN